MAKERLDRLENAMHAMEIDALALNPGPSLAYFTGLDVHLMERPVLALFVPGKDPALILPQLEEPKLSALDFPVQPFLYPECPERWLSLFRQAMQYAGLDRRTIGVEPRQLRLLEYQLMQNACQSASFQDATPLMASLRSRKEEQELTEMRRAATIAVNALEATLPRLEIGMTEREVAAELVMQLLRCGSDATLPFAPVVAVGANSANPHATPGSTRLREGELLLIDWGARSNGYASDLTRTFCIGSVGEEERQIHALVLQANQAARAVGGPGVCCGEIDRAARSCITEAGYGRYFSHRTGHGLGLECHEEPFIRDDNRQRLRPGMVYTVEPGIYLPERFGVRIEDDVLVTPEGVELLADCPRDLRRIGQ